MEIKTFSIGDHVWLMKDNAVAECEVIAIAIDCFFGNERLHENDVGKIQCFTDELTIGLGVKYTLVECRFKNSWAKKFTQVHERCYATKEELIKTL
jgi:hypothetical protein